MKVAVASLVLICAGRTIFGAAEASVAAQQIVALGHMKPSSSRKFSIEYVAKVSGIQPGAKKVRVWIPVPQDSTVQKITDLSFSQKTQLTTEPAYGNRIAVWDVENPTATLEGTMSFVCERREIVMDLSPLAGDSPEVRGDFSRFLQPDKLVI